MACKTLKYGIIRFNENILNNIQSAWYNSECVAGS